MVPRFKNPRWIEAGAGNRVCFISEGNDPGHERSMTYHQVLAQTCRLVGACVYAGCCMLEGLGFGMLCGFRSYELGCGVS